jgi:hypothetical protein
VPERRLDEDDDNWVLANHGRGTGRTRMPAERVRSTPPITQRQPLSNEELWQQSRDDIRRVYERMGLIAPGTTPSSESEPEPEPEEGPDDWRDDWRDIRMNFPQRREPRRPYDILDRDRRRTKNR